MLKKNRIVSQSCTQVTSRSTRTSQHCRLEINTSQPTRLLCFFECHTSLPLQALFLIFLESTFSIVFTKSCLGATKVCLQFLTSLLMQKRNGLLTHPNSGFYLPPLPTKPLPCPQGTYRSCFYFLLDFHFSYLVLGHILCARNSSCFLLDQYPHSTSSMTVPSLYQ